VGVQPLGNMDAIASNVVLQLKKTILPPREGFVSTCILRNFPEAMEDKKQPY